MTFDIDLEVNIDLQVNIDLDLCQDDDTFLADLGELVMTEVDDSEDRADAVEEPGLDSGDVVVVQIQ